jgi:hypothetical protein
MPLFLSKNIRLMVIKITHNSHLFSLKLAIMPISNLIEKVQYYITKIIDVDFKKN